VDESDEFEAVVCTKEAIGAVQGGQATGQARRQINFRSQVLPLILAEMQDPLLRPVGPSCKRSRDL